MNEKNLSDKAIVNIFTSFMQRTIDRLVIDYARKVRNPKVQVVSFNDDINISVSLSNCVDSDIFYLLEIKNIREKFEKGFNKLTKTERTLVRLLELEYTPSDISKIMNIDLESVYSLKSRTKKKFKKYMED